MTQEAPVICVCFCGSCVPVCVLFYLVRPGSHSTPWVLVYHRSVSHFHNNSGSGHHQTRSGVQGTQCSSTYWDLGSLGRTSDTPCSLAYRSWTQSPGATEELVIQQYEYECHISSAHPGQTVAKALICCSHNVCKVFFP